MVNEGKKKKKDRRCKKEIKEYNLETAEKPEIPITEEENIEKSTDPELQESYNRKVKSNKGDDNEGKKKKKDKRNKKKIKECNLETIEKSEIVTTEENTEETPDPELQESYDHRKRIHSKAEPESEDDEKPKLKKKKKKPFPERADGEKKGKKSIRQMKREKHAQRQAEAQSASKDQLKSQCLSYLSQWKHDKQNWKFMKVKQVWLYKNKFSSSLMPDCSWPLLLEYFESAKGNIRNLLLEDANKVIKQMDEYIEHNGKQNNINEDENEDLKEQNGPIKPDETSYKRARDLIQCLQE